MQDSTQLLQQYGDGDEGADGDDGGDDDDDPDEVTLATPTISSQIHNAFP